MGRSIWARLRGKRRDKKAEAFDAALAAEAAATRAGLAAFAAHREGFTESSPLLRRNIHRLEKGLSMPRRKPVFGVDFIDDTVALYARLVGLGTARPDEKQWAHDVLRRYFEAVDVSDPRIAPAHDRWRALPGPDAGADECSPYPFSDLARYARSPLEDLPDAAGFGALCRARRSQRWFEDTPVPQDAVRRAVEAALQAPSACNRQPFAFYHARSRKMVKAITDLPLGTKGFGEALPGVIAVVGDLSMYSEPRDRHLIYIDAALAAMQFMLAMTAARLGTVPINWPDLPENHAALRDLLGLAPHQVPIMLIGYGVPKPEAMIPYSAKRSADEVLHDVD